MSESPAVTGPLQGIRILDLTAVVMGLPVVLVNTSTVRAKSCVPADGTVTSRVTVRPEMVLDRVTTVCPESTGTKINGSAAVMELKATLVTALAQ